MNVQRKVEIETDKFEVGDVIDFTLNDGEEVQAMAVKQEKNGMLFCMVDYLERKYTMHTSKKVSSGYEGTYLRKKLNSVILDQFPESIRKKMLTFENGDYLRLPTEKEIFGCNRVSEDEPEDVRQWEPMKRLRNRDGISCKNGEGKWYWLMNKYKGSTYYPSTGFSDVDPYGDLDSAPVFYHGGVRPVFILSEGIDTDNN